MHLLTKLFERNHGFLPLLRCIPDDRSAVLLPARPSRRLPHLDSEYAERTRTVCLVRCGCTADSSLLSDDDEACKNSVIKIGPPDIDMPGNANPESFRSSSEVLKRFRVFYFAVFSSQIVSRFFPSIQIQRYTRFICSSSFASRSVFTITWPIRSVPSAMAETSCPSG